MGLLSSYYGRLEGYVWKIALIFEATSNCNPQVISAESVQLAIKFVEKLKQDLGYHDVVGVEEGHRRAVEWLLANKPEPGGEHEQLLGDPFDYKAEDAFFEAYEKFARELEAIPFEGYYSVHRYQHPREPWQKGITSQVTDRKTARG